MSNIDDLLDNFDDEEVYFDPELSSIVPEGSYPAKIVGLFTKEITTKKGGKGMLFKPKYRLDETVRPPYSNKELDDVGIWRFYGVKDENGKRITGGSNIGYKRFLDKLHIPMQKIEYEGKTILKLPSIATDLIKGKSVVISVKHDEWQGTYGRNITATATLVRIRNESLNGQGDA